jgi:hypothetical protein
VGGAREGGHSIRVRAKLPLEKRIPSLIKAEGEIGRARYLAPGRRKSREDALNELLGRCRAESERASILLSRASIFTIRPFTNTTFKPFYYSVMLAMFNDKLALLSGA